MKLKSTLFYILLLLMFSACNNNVTSLEEHENPSNQIALSLNNRANSQLDIFCFALHPGATQYTYEKMFSSTVASGLSPDLLNITIVGSLPRLLYFASELTEEQKRVIQQNITGVTADEFENQTMVISNSGLPQSPFQLIAKSECASPSTVRKIAVELTQTVSCLSIENQSAELLVDSLVLPDAVPGVFLFNNTIPQLKRTNVNYGNAESIYIYPTNQSTLLVYGKYKSIRFVSNIPLRDIKRGTKYKVTLRYPENGTISPSDNILWKVSEWDKVEHTESTPDWY